LSASSLAKFQTCPEQWRLEKLQGKRSRVGHALVVGSAFDGAFNNMLSAKIVGASLSLDDTKVAAVMALREKVDEAGDESEIAWDDGGRTAAEKQSLDLVEAYYPYAQRIEPVTVQEKITLDGLPIPIIGYTDVRTRDAVIDLKTSKKMVKKLQPNWRLQANIYRAATRLPVEFHIASKTTLEVGTPAEYPELATEGVTDHTVGVTLRYAGRVMSQIHAMYAIYGPDEPWPGAWNDNSFFSGACAMCSFQPTCDWWAS
jgi:hypothetical protein